MNEKVISCHWNITKQLKKITKKKKKVEYSFFVEKTEGHLEKETKSNLFFRFEPHQNGKFSERFKFSFKDSNKNIDFECRGEGIIPDL